MADPFVKNAADEQEVAESKRQENALREQEIADMRWVLSTKQGRRVLWRYLSRAGVFQTSYTGNSEGTLFNEGKRVMGTTIIADVTAADPNAFVAMMLEAKADAEDAARSVRPEVEDEEV